MTVTRKQSQPGVALVAAMVWLAPIVAHDARAQEIVGLWRGTSICVDRTHYPACNNEQVVYEVRSHQGTRDTVTIRADKIVNGARDFMGEFDFARQADSSWVTDIRAPRFHLQMRITVAADRMTGVMTDLEANRRVRDMSLTRVP